VTTDDLFRRKRSRPPGHLILIPSIPATAVPPVTTEQMCEVDRAMIDDFGISLLQMMENAGRHLAELARFELGGRIQGQTIIVLAGPGNNGGGGMVAARHLTAVPPTYGPSAATQL
jgi:hypothetical protein